MHTFSPAKMWISELDALRKPLLPLYTQADAALPWATIDMDFMNLNQAAHGDREHGVHAHPPAGAADDGLRARVQPCRARTGRVLGPEAAAAAARGLKLARFGDNMRNDAVTEGDKVEG
jgi:L-arabinose isomerase